MLIETFKNLVKFSDTFGSSAKVSEAWNPSEIAEPFVSSIIFQLFHILTMPRSNCQTVSF